MDLSAVIFVVLALAWAVYLIPKALKHHDEMASDRLVESHSDRVRILRRKSGSTETVEVETEVKTEVRTEAKAEAPPEVARPARSAARRRRRVLAALLLVLAVVSGLAWYAVVPVWAPAVPGALIVVFLVIARFSVRKAKRSSLAQRRPVRTPVREEQVVFAQVPGPASDTRVEEPVDVALHEPELAAEVLADDGALWDPLPMTLPTYVNKARARRTVRTIELTGLHSSGHDQDDSALARGADDTPETAADDAHRRVAGA